MNPTDRGRWWGAGEFEMDSTVRVRQGIQVESTDRGNQGTGPAFQVNPTESESGDRAGEFQMDFIVRVGTG